MDPSISSSQNAVGSGVVRMNEEFISVGEALKLVPPFKGNKQEVLAFIGNVDTAFAVINPEQETILYKFVLTHISGEPRTAIIHRNLDSWAELKEFLQNSYAEERTDLHASQLFKARQGKDARVTDWIHKIQTLGSQFREAALLNCNKGEREGLLDLADRLRNICFIQGLASDRIQIIVRSRNYQNFDEIAETALVEESAIASRQDRYRLEGTSTQRCGNCEKLAHVSNKCYARNEGEVRVNPAVREPPAKLLASDAVKKATWPEIVKNHCGDWKAAIHIRRRETSQDGRTAAARPSPLLNSLRRHMRVGTLIVATIHLQLIQNRYRFRSFTVLQCSHQHCVQPVASDVEVVGYL